MQKVHVLLMIGVMGWGAHHVQAGLITSDVSPLQMRQIPGNQVNLAVTGDPTVWPDYRTGIWHIDGYDRVAQIDFPARTEAASRHPEGTQLSVDESIVQSPGERLDSQPVPAPDLATRDESAVSPGAGDQTRGSQVSPGIPAYLTAYDDSRAVILTALVSAGTGILFLRWLGRRRQLHRT